MMIKAWLSDADIERASEAARRWRERQTARNRKRRLLKERRYTEADTPERIAKRLDRLGEWALATLGGRPFSDEVIKETNEALRREEVSAEAVERITGRTRDLMSIEFFELGLLAAECVGRVVTMGQANGTGFLVAPGLMMTNEHVLGSEEVAAVSEIELNFEPNRVGAPKSVEVLRLLPERFFLADPKLDFALVAVDSRSRAGTQLDEGKFLPLIGEEGKARIGEAVNIIQHPDGRPKEVVIRNNQLVDLPEGAAMDLFFHYQSDTEEGSSGSPVFNDQWEVVALHHSAVPKTDEEGRLVDAEGNVLGEGDSPSRIVWIANEGIRVSRLVKAIREAELSPAEASLRDRALEEWKRRGKPAVAEAAADRPTIIVQSSGGGGRRDDAPGGGRADPATSPQRRRRRHPAEKHA